MTQPQRGRDVESTVAGMRLIKKVLNSSVVLVEDERGIERVLLGKGIGYGAKPGDVVDDTLTDSVFVSLSDADQRHLVELFAQIPGQFVEFTREIVADAVDAGLELDPHIYLTLTDHLHFAVERQRRGLVVVNRLVWELKAVYPVEFGVGTRAVQMLRARLATDLPDEEAANIAFHLANASVGLPAVDPLRIVQFISAVTTIVSNTSGIALMDGDLHAHRFLVHLQFFAERLFSGGMLDSDDDDLLFAQMSRRHPRAVSTAERVRAYVRARHGLEVTNEEVAFLAVHIARASSDDRL